MCEKSHCRLSATPSVKLVGTRQIFLSSYVLLPVPLTEELIREALANLPGPHNMINRLVNTMVHLT